MVDEEFFNIRQNVVNEWLADNNDYMDEGERYESEDDEPAYPLDAFGAEIIENNDNLANLEHTDDGDELDNETLFNMAWEECVIRDVESRSVRGREVPINNMPIFKGPTAPRPKHQRIFLLVVKAD